MLLLLLVKHAYLESGKDNVYPLQAVLDFSHLTNV